MELIARIRVQTDSAVKQWGQLQFGYNSSSQRIDISYVRVLKSDGNIVLAGADAVQDLSSPVERIAPMYSDFRQKHVTVPGLRPGDVLEYDVVMVMEKAIVPGQFWMQHDFDTKNIILDEQLEVELPATREVKVKSKPGFEPKVTESNGRKTHRWSSSHTVREDDKEKKGKKKKTRKPQEEFPDVQVTTFSSWEQVGKWYAGLEKDRRNPSPEVRAKAAELTTGLNSDIEKVQALYDYTAKNFRYVSLSFGQGRYQPHAAAEVLHNQYGDCKDKNSLLESLLAAQGMHASSVLINSRRKLDPDMPSPSQFDHMITMLPLGKDEVWMDTTTEIAPFRLLAISLRKKQALVIPEEGTPHLEETPADPPMPDTQWEEVDGKVTEGGRLEARIKYTVRGDSELVLRSIFRHTASSDLPKFLEKINAELGGEVSKYENSDPANTREPFTFSYQVSKPNFVDWSKKKSEVRLPMSSFVPPAVREESEDEEPSGFAEPVKLGPPNEHGYRVKLELAARYTPQMPVPISLDRGYAAYQSTYKAEGNVFSAERKFTLRKGELLPGEAENYRALRRSIVADSNQRLIVESKLAGTPGDIPEMKTEDLVRSGNAARRNGDYKLAIELLKKAVQDSPTSKTAWNDLGLAYLDSRQDDLAVSAFKKQIDVNPYDQYAFNNIGRIYLRQRNYDEAVKWFRKQLEIDPLDKYAHSNLGIAFLESKKYDEAVPEFQRAAQITPNNADIQVRLGQAYLNLGQDEKAMMAFDQAVGISATPGIWNNIAYWLVEKNAHLDRARRYSESALTTTTAALSNVSLEQINARDLHLSSSLASSWDTLGWIDFSEGKLDTALRHVMAAFQLGQSWEEADHLGQIFEKRGDKKEAVHYYALAMNARRPAAEVRSRLIAVAGGEDKATAAIDQHRSELEQMRTIKVGNPEKQDGSADFFLVFSGSAGHGGAVEGAKFISGGENLKSMTDTLSKARYDQTFPDETPVRILRRGKLTCSAASASCSLVLALPEDVKSVD